MTWGAACSKCGHPASCHGMTFCQVDAGAEYKRRCDCDGYENREPRCKCGWTANGTNHYHAQRLVTSQEHPNGK